MIIDKLTVIFQEVLDQPDLTLSPESNTDSIRGWDSITNLLLISKIEEVYEIEFDLEIIYSAEKISDWIQYIQKHIS